MNGTFGIEQEQGETSLCNPFRVGVVWCFPIPRVALR